MGRATEKKSRGVSLRLVGTCIALLAVVVACGYCYYLRSHQPSIAWTYPAGYWFGRAEVDESGNLLIGSDGFLNKLDGSGNLVWKCAIDGPASYGPVKGPDGRLYIVSGSSLLNCISPSGQLIWQCRFENGGRTGRVLPTKDAVYVSASFYCFNVISLDGKLLWTRSEPAFFQLPLVGEDGRIYVGQFCNMPQYNQFYCLQPDGSVAWQFNSVDGVKTRAVFNSAGDILFGTGAALVCLSTSGQVLWQHPVNKKFQSDIAVDQSGNLYYNAGGGVASVRPDGTERWYARLIRRNETHLCMRSPPYLGCDGIVYAGAGVMRVPSVNLLEALSWRQLDLDDFKLPGRLASISSADGSIQWQFDYDQGLESEPALGPGGIVYICSENGTADDECELLAISPPD